MSLTQPVSSRRWPRWLTPVGIAVLTGFIPMLWAAADDWTSTVQAVPTLTARVNRNTQSIEQQGANISAVRSDTAAIRQAVDDMRDDVKEIKHVLEGGKP